MSVDLLVVGLAVAFPGFFGRARLVSLRVADTELLVVFACVIIRLLQTETQSIDVKNICIGGLVLTLWFARFVFPFLGHVTH